MAIEEVGVKLVTENSDKFEREMKAAERALFNFTFTVKDAADEAETSGKAGERALDKFADSAGDSFKRIDAFAEIAIGALRRVGEMAVNAAMDAGRAIADFAVDSVTVAGNYEATLNRFSAVTGDSLAEAGMSLGEFSDLFLEMGAVTQYSAGEAAQAAVNLAKGGLAPAEIAAGGLAATLALAAAGELDLAESAEILAKQLGVWADKGVTAEQITNLLAQAANASTVDVDELANGLANVQGRAAGMGVEYQDLVQTMALISPAFESASTAGTSLNNFLARLIPSTDKAETAMIDLGLATADGNSLFFDAQGAFIGMEQTIGLLNAATVGLSEEERSAAFSIIFGNDAMGAAIQLADSTATEYDEMGASMDAAGSAAEQADKRNQGFNFALEEMRGSMETLQIVLGGALLPTLTDFIQNHITPGINRLLEFAQSVAESEDPLGTFAQKMDEVLPGFEEFVALAREENIATAIVAEMEKAIPGFTSFLASIAAIAQGIQDFATNLTAQVTATFESWGPTIQGATDTVGMIVTAFTDTIGKAWEEFTRDFSDSDIQGLLTAFGALWTSLQPVIMAVLSVLGAAILFFLGVVSGMLSGVLEAADYFVLTLTGIALSISVILDGYADIIGGAMDLIRAIFTGNIDGILDAVKRMGTGLVEIFFGAFTLVFSVVAGGAATILSFIGGFVTGFIDFFKTLYDELVGHSIIPDMVNEIIEWIAKLPTRAMELVGEMVSGIKALFTETDWGAIGSGIIDGITNGITGAAGALASAAQGVANQAYEAVTGFLGMESPSKLFMDVGKMTMEGFAIGLQDAAALPVDALEAAISGMAIDAPSMAGAPVAGLAPMAATNNYNSISNVYQGDSYGLNVRTTENTGSVGNTIRSLQSISRVRGGAG